MDSGQSRYTRVRRDISGMRDTIHTEAEQIPVERTDMMSVEDASQLDEKNLIFSTSISSNHQGPIIQLEMRTDTPGNEDFSLGRTLFAQDHKKIPKYLFVNTGYFTTAPTGAGLGTKMFNKLSRVFQYLARVKQSQVVHAIHPTNENNKRLYERLGYQPDNTKLYDDSGEFLIKTFQPETDTNSIYLYGDEVKLLAQLSMFYS